MTGAQDNDSDVDGKTWVNGVAAAVGSGIVVSALSPVSVGDIVAGAVEESIWKSTMLTSSERLLETAGGGCTAPGCGSEVSTPLTPVQSMLPRAGGSTSIPELATVVGGRVA